MACTQFHDAALAVVKRLREHGHTAYFAGGCVRDMLLGREPKDYDVATDAPPPRICELFRPTRKVGAQFGVVLVKHSRHWIEVATFRTDLSYTDGRHPDAVVFSTPQEDAMRRDFTINGMFYDPIVQKVIDYVGGQTDLAARVLRAIGEPRHRFTEDHLRVLRAVRFASTYDCVIEPETWRAVCEMAPMIRTVSAERIRDELEKSFVGPHRVRAFAFLADAGLLPYLWADASWAAEQIDRSRGILEHLPNDAGFEVVMAALLLDRSLTEVQRLCRALTCSNVTREAVAWLVRHQEAPAVPSRLTPADLKLLMQSEHFDKLLILFAAMCKAAGRSLDACEEIRRRAAAIPAAEVRPAPLITGEDLIAMSLPQGPLFRSLLDRVYYAQLNDPALTREQALRLVEEFRRGDAGS